MNTSMRIAILLVAGAVVVAANPHPAWAGKPTGGGNSGGYTFVALDARPGLAFSWVSEVKETVNGSFLCVGYMSVAGLDQAVVWEVVPGSSDYSVSTHYLANGEWAAALNPNSAIVGYGYGTGLYWHDHTSQPLLLPPLVGDNATEALGINAAGVIVGQSSGEDSTAVAWRAIVVNSVPQIEGPFALGTPSVPAFGGAFDINECDANGFAQVVGGTEAGPVIWVVDCLSPTLASTGPVSLVPPNQTAHGTAVAINDAGDACGNNTALAFRCLAVGAFQELSTPRRAYSWARDINDSRQVVGQVFQPGKGTFGTLWQADGSRVYLYSFLRRSSEWERIWWGYSITDSGAIAATGSLRGAEGNETRALLMIRE